MASRRATRGAVGGGGGAEEVERGRNRPWYQSSVFYLHSSRPTPTADILSAVKFDDSGKFLATGDKGGRIVIFERSSEAEEAEGGLAEYKFFTEFQSHEPEFDYLKSLEIEEKINSIRWCKPTSNSREWGVQVVTSSREE